MVEGPQVESEFTGKSDIEHHIELADKRLAKLIQRCSELPGYSVFQYFDSAVLCASERAGYLSGGATAAAHAIHGADDRLS